MRTLGLIAGMVVMLGFNCAFAGNVLYQTNGYTVRVAHDGRINRLNFPPTSPNHVSVCEYALYYNSSIYYFSGFAIVSDVSVSGNVLRSLISNGEMMVALTTVFSPSNWFEQTLQVSNATNYPLANATLYRVQDGDLFNAAGDDHVGRDTSSRAVYQSEFGLHIAQNLFTPGMAAAAQFQGGEVGTVYNNVDNNALDGTFVQTNDTAVAQGVVLGTLQAGQSNTCICRVSLGASLDEAMANALPITFSPVVKGFKFAVNSVKPNSDSLGFSATFNPAAIGLTSLSGRFVTVYVNEYPVLDGVAGTVKSSASGDSATYESATAKMILSIKPAKQQGKMSVKVKAATLTPGIGTLVNGVNGVFNPLVIRCALDTTNVAGRANLIVPYKAKLDKGFSGKQW